MTSRPMRAVRLVVPTGAPQRWHAMLADRLSARGHRVCRQTSDVTESAAPAIDLLVAFERTVYRLGRSGPVVDAASGSPADPEEDGALVLDLAGRPAAPDALQLRFDGVPAVAAAHAALPAP